MTHTKAVASARAAGRAFVGELKRLKKLPPRKRSIAVVTHERPDGDALGSSLAMASVLRAAGYDACAVGSVPISRQFRFLKHRGLLVEPKRVSGALEVVFSLDATDPVRLGEAGAVFARAKRKLMIDHHPYNLMFGDVNWVDTGAAAVGQMVYQLARALKWSVPLDACEALYVAIMTDTGRFTFGNTTADALRIAGDLVQAGVDPERVSTGIYGERPRNEWELEARLRSSLKMEDGGAIATVELRDTDFEETKTTPAAAQDFASLPRTLEGVKMGIFFYEIEGGSKTKVGFRSTRRLDVNRLAASLGGGGHRQASGCTIEGGLDVAKAVVLRAAKKHMGSNGAKRRRR